MTEEQGHFEQGSPPEPAPPGARTVPIREEPIRLGQFLKLAGFVASGSDAKPLLDGGLVQVNGLQERRRGRQLRRGDVDASQGPTVVVS